MRKALPITIIFLLLTLTLTQLASADFTVANDSNTTVKVIYGYFDPSQEAWRIKGYYHINQGASRQLKVPDEVDTVFARIWTASEVVAHDRPSGWTWAVHPRKGFEVVYKHEERIVLQSNVPSEELMASADFYEYANNMTFTYQPGNGSVNIFDRYLRDAITDALGKARVAKITPADMLRLRRLQYNKYDGHEVGDIHLLTGLEFAKNLTQLYLDEHKISDLSPLTGLTNLTALQLQHNEISDVSPLAGLINLTWLLLYGNEISDVSPLANLNNLTDLILSHNKISDFSPIAGLIPNLARYEKSNQDVPADDGGDGMSDGVAEDVSQPVNIPDPDLRAAIEKKLGKASGTTITQSDMLKLTSLYPSHKPDIQDLTGLEFATNLKRLSFSNFGTTGGKSNERGKLSDISPLAGLANLTHLNLEKNRISDISPLAGLTNLQSLDLSDNQISDISPLAGLTNLQSLYLSYNEISDFSPIAGLIPNLRNYHKNYQRAVGAIEEVNIPDRTLQASIKKELDKTSGHAITKGDMSRLSELSIFPASLLQDLPAIQDLTGLEFATNLKVLKVWDHQISDISPLAGLTNLIRLRLEDNQISDVAPLAQLKNLKGLYLSNNQISDISPLAGLTNLTQLSLDGNQLTNISPLAQLKNLESLELRNNKISDFSPIAGLIPNLRTYTNHSQRALSVHIPDPKLRFAIEKALGKSSGAKITSADMLKLTKLNPFALGYLKPGERLGIKDLTGLEFAVNLKELGLSGTEITDLSPLAGLKQLETLALARSRISDISALSGLVNLKTLLIGENFISDLSPLARLKNLQALRLSVNRISDLSPLAGLTNLRRLWLRDNHISDVSPLAGLTRLTDLDLRRNLISDFSPIAGIVRNIDPKWQDFFGGDQSRPGDGWFLYKKYSPAGMHAIMDLDWVLDAYVICGGSDTDGSGSLRQFDIDLGMSRHLTYKDDMIISVAVPQYAPLYFVYGRFGADFASMRYVDNFRWRGRFGHETMTTIEFANTVESPHYLMTGGENGWVNVWNTADPQDIYHGPHWKTGGPIWALEPRSLLIVDGDNNVDDWEWVVPSSARRAERNQIDGFFDGIVYGLGRLFGKNKKTIVQLDRAYEVHTERVTSLSQSSSSRGWFVTGSEDNTLQTWSIVDNKSISVRKEHGDDVNSVDISPQGDFIASGSRDQTVCIWRCSGGRITELKHRFSMNAIVTVVAFSPKGEYLAVGTSVPNSGLYIYKREKTIAAAPSMIVASDASISETADRFLSSDVNEDGRVDTADLVLVSNYIGQTGSIDPRVDVSGDGIVTITDLVLVAQHLGQSMYLSAPTAVVVPAGLTYNTVAGWIDQARVEDDGSLVFHQGIAKLEYLLTLIIPEETALLHNYPNPFNPETWIPYHLAKPANVTLTIYAIDGKVVRRLDLGHQAAGYYQSKSRAAYWDGRNAVGERVASGIYFYTLTAGDFSATRKMLIRK